MSNKHKKLEEDIAACPYPVFGLQESVYDLEYVDHYEEEGRFTICYQSRSKPLYRLSSRSLWTFSLESSLYVHEGPLSIVHDIYLNQYLEEIIREKIGLCSEEREEEELWQLVRGYKWEIDLAINGIRFLGAMLHTEDPFNMTGWCYSSESHHSHIDGRAFGLNGEEVFEVLSALAKIK